jgi:hypothetical protein
MGFVAVDKMDGLHPATDAPVLGKWRAQAGGREGSRFSDSWKRHPKRAMRSVSILPGSGSGTPRLSSGGTNNDGPAGNGFKSLEQIWKALTPLDIN